MYPLAEQAKVTGEGKLALRARQAQTRHLRVKVVMSDEPQTQSNDWLRFVGKTLQRLSVAR